MYNGNENIVICNHPLLKHKITILRDKNTGTNEFRTVVEEIAMFVGYEALRNLELEEVEIETPIETAMCPVIAGRKAAIVPILRAGLGMVGGMLKLMPSAKIGHIGMYRDEETFEPHEYFCKLPSAINSLTVGLTCGRSGCHKGCNLKEGVIFKKSQESLTNHTGSANDTCSDLIVFHNDFSLRSYIVFS